MVLADHVAAVFDQVALDDALQFSHIAWESLFAQPVDRFVIEGGYAVAHFGPESPFRGADR